MTRRHLLAAAGAATLPSCGYRVSGKADLLPREIQTIAIPAFANSTVRYRLTDRLASALTREFISRTRYHVVADAADADAVLRGSVVNYLAYPTVVDNITSRATAVQVNVFLAVQLVEQKSGRVLYSRPSFEVRQRYEVATDQVAYLEESPTALDRMSREVASTLVSSILENF